MDTVNDLKGTRQWISRPQIVKHMLEKKKGYMAQYALKKRKTTKEDWLSTKIHRWQEKWNSNRVVKEKAHIRAYQETAGYETHYYTLDQQKKIPDGGKQTWPKILQEPFMPVL